MWYEIIYTSTPPWKQRFSLNSWDQAVSIRIKYPKAGVLVVKDGTGKTIAGNGWDSTIMQPSLLKGGRCGGFCGENRYVGVINILDFYLTPGCSIFIEPIDSIQVSVRMNWTFSGFFASGGTTKFMDRVASSLGIKPANIKIVSVYEGSVVVDYAIVEDSSKTLAKSGGMASIQNTLT